MMRLSLVSSLLSLLLVNSSVAVSEKKFLDQVILDSVLTEDEIFWGRNLQGESMSVPAEICEVTVSPGLLSVYLSLLYASIVGSTARFCDCNHHEYYCDQLSLTRGMPLLTTLLATVRDFCRSKLGAALVKVLTATHSSLVMTASKLPFGPLRFATLVTLISMSSRRLFKSTMIPLL